MRKLLEQSLSNGSRRQRERLEQSLSNESRV